MNENVGIGELGGIITLTIKYAFWSLFSVCDYKKVGLWGEVGLKEMLCVLNNTNDPDVKCHANTLTMPNDMCCYFFQL